MPSAPEYERLGSDTDVRNTAAIKIQKRFRHCSQHAKEAASANKYYCNDSEIHQNELVSWNFQTMRFLVNPLSSVKDPGEFAGMTAELFALVVGICYVLTMICNPQIFVDNPLLTAWGYNNICVGFDLSPAREVAAVLWTAIVYCTLQYVVLVTKRITLENRKGKLKKHPRWVDNVMIVIHITYGLTTATFLLCFMVPPTISRQMHTRPFEAYMLFRFLSMFCCVWEYSMETDPFAKKLVKATTWEFLMVYGVISVYLITTAELTYWHHDKFPADGPLLPWQLSMAVDWSWMLCSAVSGIFIPKPVLLVGNKILHPETLESMQTRFAVKAKPRWRCGCCCRKRAQKVGDIQLGSNEEARHSPQDATSIEPLADIFGEMSRDHLEKDPACTSEPRSGLTVTVLKAKLTIDERVEQLAPWHRDGLFSSPGAYDAIVRINVTEHGAARLSIRLDVPESMEVLNECDTISTKAGFRQVDMLLAEGFEQFVAPSPAALLQLMRLARAPSFSALLDGPSNWLVRCVSGFQRAVRGLDNTTGIVGKAYFSGLPFKLGSGTCKFGVMPKLQDPLREEDIPCQKPGASMTDKEEEVTAKYATAMVARIQKTPNTSATNTFEWDFVLQVGKCHPSHSLTEGDIPWDKTVSPYMAVGTLTIYLEPALAGGIAGQDAPPLYFNPWNQLKAHRPIGALNNARLCVYQKHCEARKRAGGGKQPDRVCPFLASLGSP